MKRTLILTSLLIVGLILSQLLPIFWGTLPTWFVFLREFLTMTFLSFIMIGVGREFEIDMTNKKKYLIDYGVAATAATLPWIFCSLYFFTYLMPEESASGNPLWIEALLAGRFAAPTSAGVLFSMLAAAGLAGTWAFHKIRILAIFDDLDTILLLIPLKILLVGMIWQLGAVLLLMFFMIILAFKYYRQIHWPVTWPWILSYSFLITAFSKILDHYTQDPVTLTGVHIEVLLPAFLLGCILRPHHGEPLLDPRDHPLIPDREESADLIISCSFMLLVGLTMPAAFGANATIQIDMSAGEIIFHVLAITLVSNIGKMFPLFCYGKEASIKERLAVSIAMFPRGEVGAGVLAVTISYGIQGPLVTIGFLSLALNLVLTGFFIFIVKWLLDSTANNLQEKIPLGGKK